MTNHLFRGTLSIVLSAVAATFFHCSDAQAAKVPRVILKEFFQTGDKPTQAQFSDLIDSYIHQTDDGLTLVGIGVVADGSAKGHTIRVGGNVGINELLPDTRMGFWAGPYPTPSSPDQPDMCTEFCGTSGYLPLKYQNAAGTAVHYGFLRISMESDPGVSPGAAFFVSHLVWESTPNTTLTTYPVPEPTVVALVVAAAPLRCCVVAGAVINIAGRCPDRRAI